MDDTYSPSTADEQALFDVLQSYTFAVFTSTLQLSETSTIVRRYSIKGSNDEGNAQLLYKDLVKVMSGGIVAQTTRANLEKKVNELRLNSSWSKGVRAFLVHFEHLIKDLRELREPTDIHSYNDNWCISAIDMCLTTHQEMSSHINSLASTRASLEEAFATQGFPMPARTFEDYLSQLQTHATVLDNRVSTTRRTTNSTNRTNSNGGRGSGGRGSGNNTNNNGRGGRGRQGRYNRTPTSPDVMPSDPTDPNVWLTPEQYRTLTEDQLQHRKARIQGTRNRQQRTNTTTTTPAPAPSAAGTTPTTFTFTVDATSLQGTSVPPTVAIPNHSDATVASTVAPGSVLRQMMSTSAARPPTSGEDIQVNGVTYRRVNATHLYRVNQSSSLSPPGSLIDGGSNGGLLGKDDAVILEVDLVARADVIGVTDDTMPSLRIGQGASRLETVDGEPIIGIFSHYAL